MLNASTTPFSEIFPKDMIPNFINGINDSQLQFIRMLWESLILFLKNNTWNVIGFLIILLIISFIIALFGYWWIFATVLYNYLYFGIHFGIGLLFGPDIFANEFFNIISFIVYLYSYKIVGKFIIK